MPAPYSDDLRKKSIEAYEAQEGSQAEIAKRFKICLLTFKRYWKRYQETGNINAIKENKGRKASISHAKDEQRLKKYISQYPDATLSELCEHYNKKSNKEVGLTVMYRTLERFGIKRKKKSHYAQEQERTDVQSKRENFKKCNQ